MTVDDGDGTGGTGDGAVQLRAYDADADREALWALKRAFELELGAGTGDEGKADRYEGKLTDEYRERYLRWVDRCVASDPYCVTVAEVAGGGSDAAGGAGSRESMDGDDAGTTDGDDAGTTDGDDDGATDGDDDGATDDASTPDRGEEPALAGYVFVLPWDLAMIWDAAVVNEIYVRERHRGSGVADELMDAAVELARDQDPPLPRLVLDVDRANDRARAFYRRHGFEHWGEMVARGL